VDSAWTFELSGSGNAGWSLSPDGSRLAIGLSTNSGDDIWVKRMPDGPASRLTFDTTSDVRPRWTPDGQSVIYVINGQHVLRQRRADGTGETTTVLDAGKPVLEGQWSRDGRWLIARTGGENLRTGGRDIVGIEAGTGGKVRPLVANPGADESAAALSPDGRWLAYQSDETGRSEIYLRPFPGTREGKWQVSLEGGHSPLWAHSGRELFFLDAARNMVSVSVAGTGAPELGQRHVLFRMGTELYSNDPEYYTPFDIAPDDQHFLMAEALHDFLGAHPRYLLVENWPEEVRSLMAAAR
jgi:Tol biopolymer transport system component